MKRHIQIKCPVCQGRTQSPSSIRREKTGNGLVMDKIQIGARHCRKCNLLIPTSNLVSYWDGSQVIRPQPELKIIKVKRRHHTVGIFVAVVQ